MRTWLMGFMVGLVVWMMWWSSALDARSSVASMVPTVTAIPANQLLGDYLFVARTFRDHTPNKNHLTCQRCPTFVNEFAPAIGAGIRYAPNQKHLLKTQKGMSFDRKSFAVSVWLRRDTPARERIVISHGIHRSHTFELGITANHAPFCRSAGTTIRASRAIDTQAHMLTCTFDLARSQLRLYITVLLVLLL